MADHVGCRFCPMAATMMVLLMIAAQCFHPVRSFGRWDEKLDVNDVARRLVLETSASNTSAEAQLLMEFRNGISDDPWGALTTWNATQNPSVCSWRGVAGWRGVACKAGRVSALNLSGDQLVGFISPSLGGLVHLSSIDLSDNRFQGELPPSLGWLKHLLRLDASNNLLRGSIPNALSNCSSLRLLQLSHNKLTASIPPEIGKLKKISKTNLDDNNLTSSIPKSLGNCSSLSYLHLTNNYVSGRIPDELGRLHKLFFFEVRHNLLTGSIPKSIANCTAFHTLDLTNNSLSGDLPPELGMLKNLNYLNLRWNGWTGSIPASLGNLSSLTNIQITTRPLTKTLTGRIPSELGNLHNLDFLLIQFTSISGTLPVEFGKLSKLTKLYLNGNQLTGNIPPAFKNLTKLIDLEISYNQLDGDIPPWLGSLENLGALKLFRNRLSGSLPPELGNLTSMTKLNLDSNSLTGNIIPEVGKLVLLEDLSLFNNSFEGELPESLGNCSKLVHVWLFGNQISGSIPPSLFSRLTNLASFDVNDNRLSGPIPPEIASSSALTHIDLQVNNLTGQIFVQINSLTNLQQINISINNISGPIPPSIGNCKVLQVLDFSNNRLSGPIPKAALEQLTSLTSFNVSNNNLDGEIPESVGAFANVTAEDYAGNPGLCGALLGKNCTSSLPRKCRGINCRHVWIPIVSSVGGLLVMVVVAGAGLCFCVVRKRGWGICADREEDLADIPDISLFTKELTLTEELWAATAGFSDCNVLGEGGQSTVYKATLANKNGLIIAVKCLNLDLTCNARPLRDLYHELQILGSIRHKHLVKMHGFYATPSMKALLIEFVPNGTLHAHLHGDTRSSSLSLETRFKIAIGVADAMVYLHHECQKPIIHRDLKPNNILLDFEFNAKVADFGISKFVTGSVVTGEATASELFGTTGYIAPEYATSDKVSTKGDGYSYGVVLLELLTGRRPTDIAFARDGTWLTEWVREASSSGRIPVILDDAVAVELNTNAEYSYLVQKLVQIGLLCTQDLSKDRPSMRHVRQMLEEATNPNADNSPMSSYPTVVVLAHMPSFERLPGREFPYPHSPARLLSEAGSPD